MNAITSSSGAFNPAWYALIPTSAASAAAAPVLKIARAAALVRVKSSCWRRMSSERGGEVPNVPRLGGVAFRQLQATEELRHGGVRRAPAEPSTDRRESATAGGGGRPRPAARCPPASMPNAIGGEMATARAPCARVNVTLTDA